MNNIISIVTPSLNQGQFIEQTIKSVLLQEGNFYIDYIIVDGGSNDNSIEVIKKYDKLLIFKKYPIKCKGISYRWWSRLDNGQSHAINQGFKITKGDILAWINSDDFYEPGVFDFIFKEFNKNSFLDLIYGDGYYLHEESKKRELGKSMSANFGEFLKRPRFLFQPSAFFTKRVVEKIGSLDESLDYTMDYDLWLRIFKNSNTLYVPKVLANARLWEKSKTVSQIEKFAQERIRIYKKYGGNIIDPHRIKEITNNNFCRFIYQKMPRIYKLCRNVTYFLNDRLHY